MKKVKQIVSVVLCLLMLVAVVPVMEASAVTFSQLNADNVFYKQAASRTCTLCAASMMMRRYSMLRGDSNWSSITENAIRPTAWIDGTGLRWSFTYSNSSVSGISVGHYTLPGGSANESKIQAELKNCPEGIVIYYEAAPHAVLLTDYTDGVYYCADPYGGVANGRIPLTSAYKVRITNVTAYWKVTSEVVPGPTDDLTAASLDNAISIQDGVYSIHSARDENMVVDISGDSKESGANIQVYNFLDNNVQKFRIKKSGDYYFIQSVYSNNYLDIKTPIGNRSNVQLYFSNALNEEKWFFEDAGNGFVAIRNYYGYYLDIAGDSAVNHANIQIYDTLESDSQKWRLIPDAPSSSISIPEGVYTIHSAWNQNKVLDIANNSKASGANIQLFDFQASNFDVQRFRVAKSGKYYTIQSVYSNNWLDIAWPFTQRANIQLFYSKANNEEKWFFEDAGNGYINIRNYYGYYVDIAADSTENHANIQAYRTKYNNSQRWWLVPDNYTININANGGAASTSSFSVKYGDKCNLNTSLVSRAGDYKLKGWNLYRPADGKWFVAGVGWKTPAEINAGSYAKQLYVPNLSMTLDYSWIRNFSGLVSSISSFTFYAVWEKCTHTWNSGTTIKEATANEEGIIRYTCTTCGEVKDVSVAALRPTNITVNLTHVKKSYYVGESLDTSDLELSAAYSDGTTETVTEGFTCTPSKLTTPGTQTITVNYASKTCTYEVNVKVEEPAPYWGDMNGDKRIDDSDAQLVNQYLKGYVELSDEQKCFADVIFNGLVNASDYTKILRYAKGYEADPVSSTPDIRLTTTKSSYNIGDALEPEKFQVVVSSSDSANVSYIITDGFTLSGYDPNKTGAQTISTTFRGTELSTTITVVKVEHTHTWNDGTITKASTCASTGEKTFTCTSCGATRTETIAKNASNHTGGTEVQGAKVATCSSEGCTGDVYCNGCGAKLQTATIIAKIDHTWNSGTITNAATCSATGIKTYTCTACNAIKTETIPVNASNHVNKTNVAATASTCTVKGYTAGVYCNDCKKYISGHAEQPLAAHKTTTQNAKAAACTTAGYTGDQYCTTCKQTITKGSAIAALGHTSPDSNGNCTRCGTHIKDVTPSQPSNPQPNPNACKYCGKVHTGPFGWLIKFFHSILAIFKR